MKKNRGQFIILYAFYKNRNFFHQNDYFVQKYKRNVSLAKSHSHKSSSILWHKNESSSKMSITNQKKKKKKDDNSKTEYQVPKEIKWDESCFCDFHWVAQIEFLRPSFKSFCILLCTILFSFSSLSLFGLVRCTDKNRANSCNYCRKKHKIWSYKMYEMTVGK